MKAIALRWMEQGWQQGNAQMVDEMHAPHFVDHAAAGRDQGRGGFKAGITQLYAAFPDFYAQTEDLLIDEKRGTVVVRWAATGTHQGLFITTPPTNKQITFRGIEIIRIEDGLIVERWGEWNGIELLEQIGAL